MICGRCGSNVKEVGDFWFHPSILYEFHNVVPISGFVLFVTDEKRFE